MQAADLLEKFSFRVKAFQEGFEILSASRTLEDMAKSFCHVVRGSLMTTYINLFYKLDRYPWEYSDKEVWSGQRGPIPEHPPRRWLRPVLFRKTLA